MDENIGETEPKPSFIVIRFPELGSAVVDVQFENVTPLQVLAAVAYLELIGKNQLVRAENERVAEMKRNQLAVPDSGFFKASR